MIHYATAHEIAFIDFLGTHAQTNLTRRELVEKYLRTIPKRRDWGLIAPSVVQAYAQVVLKREGFREAA